MNFLSKIDRHVGAVTGNIVDQTNVLTITHGLDSRILLWDTETGKLVTKFAHPDIINKPGAINSLLYGEYLIVLFTDNIVFVFFYRD
jgi:hypothetical protein